MRHTGGQPPLSGKTVTPSALLHALAWVALDGSDSGQVWASINGAPLIRSRIGQRQRL